MVTQSRAAITRARLLYAAAVVFEKHGFAGTTISQILREAGITRGSLYFHFASKEALAQAIITEQTNWRDADSAASDSPLKQLLDLSQRFASALQSDAMVRASVRLTRDRAFAGLVAKEGDVDGAYAGWLSSVSDLLTRAEAAGQLRSDVDIDQAAYVIIAAVTGIQLVYEEMRSQRDLCARMDDVWEVVLKGLAPPDVIASLLPSEPA